MIPIYFVDTETLGFGGHAICATWTEIGDNDDAVGVATGFACIQDAIDTIIDCHTDEVIRVYMHNASYDMMRFKQQLPDSVVAIQLNGTAFMSACVSYRGKMLVIRDSMALLPASLKKLSQSFAPELAKLDLNFDDELFDIENPEHIEYAKRDVVALKHVILRYASVIKESPDKLAITAASQSFKRLKKVYSENIGKYYAVSEQWNEFFRRYYHGGRIYIRDGHCIDELHDTVSLDITSSYPAQMRSYKYPLAGKSPLKAIGRIPTLAHKGRYLVSVRVTNYRAALPILPVRVDGSPVYPHGTFVSHITDQEYEILTTQKSEYDKIDILECYYWRDVDCDYIFRAYVDEAYALKLEGDKLNAREKGSGEAMRTVGKLNLNSPYGKLAQKYIKDEENDGLIGWGDGYEELNPFGQKSEKRQADHRNVHLAAMITAAGRCQLYRAILYYGVDNVIYSDTDSVKVRKSVFSTLPPFNEVGNELGQWKPEGEYNQLRVIAPKVYIADVTDGGKTYKTIKSKGTPPSGIASIVCDGNVFKGTFDNFYSALLTHKDYVKISYVDKPSRLKSFLASGQMARQSVKSVTRPEMVKSMTYNPMTRTYHFLEIDNRDS